MTDGMQQQAESNQAAKSQKIESQSAGTGVSAQSTASEQSEHRIDASEKSEHESDASEKSTWGRSLQRTATMVVGLVLLLSLSLWGMYSLKPSDPYIQSVLQLTGDASRGHDIFQLNCATCHGLEAAGEVGPTLRDISQHRSRVALIQQVISGQTPPMPQFQPNERDMADLLAFLETL